jgi:hypothetical protein
MQMAPNFRAKSLTGSSGKTAVVSCESAGSRKSGFFRIPGLILLMVLAAIAGTRADDAEARENLPAWDQPMPLDGIWKIRSGDSLAWADPDWADGTWDSAQLMDAQHRELAPRDGYTWFRKSIVLPASPAPGRRLALRHMPSTPQEFYWDGVLIGRNGKLGATEEEERLGEGRMVAVPDRLTGPGRHVIAVRLTAEHPAVIPCPAFMAVGDPDVLELELMGETLMMFFLAGIFVFGALYRFLNYRAYGYGRNAFYFSIFVFACAAYILLQYLGAVTTLTEAQFYASRFAVGIAWYFMVSLIPDFFIFSESFPYRWVGRFQLILGVFFAVPQTLVLTGILPFHYMARVDFASQLFTYSSIGVSIWVIAWAVMRRQTGSFPALLGILSLLIGVSVTFICMSPWAWAAGVAAHIVFLARAQSVQLSERLRVHRESELRSARLEIELLKKNIQPHFLLNSLNSIIAWLEEDPKTAVHLVNALADELEILLKVSAEKTIPVAEEIRLCETHLQVMALRQDKSYRLEARDIRGDERLPPLVLHTLVENGLTHGYAGKSQGVFVLRREDIPGGVRFSLFNDGKPKEKKERKETQGEGTGLRYVRSRLEEAFPGRWTLDSRPVEGGWRVCLDLQGAP